MKLEFDTSTTKEATTWVINTPNCKVPYYQKALDAADVRNVAIGVHVPSRRIVIQFDDRKTKQEACRVFQMILGKGGAIGRCVDDCCVLDYFHAETWGLIKLSPLSSNQQDVKYIDTIVELDDVDSSAEITVDPATPLDELAVIPDIFALTMTTSRVVEIPTWQTAQTTATPDYNDLLNGMTAAGGPLTPELASQLTPRGRDHIKNVQDAVRDLVRQKVPEDDIFWVNKTPEFLRVYKKPTMPAERRLDWILWRAKALDVTLTPVTFMALFKQVSCHNNDASRQKYYQVAMTSWMNRLGKTFNWMELSPDMRIEIKNINEGVDTCYCRACKVVLNAKVKNGFCSGECSMTICRTCGDTKSEKLAIDYEATELQRDRLGDFETLTQLSFADRLKPDVEKFYEFQATIGSSDCVTYPATKADYDNLLGSLLFETPRDRMNCCKRVRTSYICSYPPWCKPCKDEFAHVQSVSRVAEDLTGGKYTWGHVNEAKRRLDVIASTPNVVKRKRFCATCPVNGARN
jgi:hypothetical protein